MTDRALYCGFRHMCWEAFALMAELDAYYVRMMHVGLLGIRRALGEHNYEWAERLVDLLHNLPSLKELDEPELPPGRARRAGGGRKHIEAKDPASTHASAQSGGNRMDDHVAASA